MFKRSLGRALRLRIEPNELSAAEARTLAAASPPVTEPHLQAFLAWRRSVLFLVALALVPLSVLRFVDASEFPEGLRFIALVPAGAEAFLCLVCWYQLKNWMSWRKQRRALFRAWMLFMAAPFLVFLIPMDPIIEDLVRAQYAGGAALDAGAAIGADLSGAVTALKVTLSVYALLTLAPKAVSLLAGTIRAGIVTKMLFPGTAGPGWIVVLASPLYTLFVFTLLVVPYQLTGSGWYVGAMLGLAAGQIALGRAGYALTRPTTHDDAVRLVARARATYVASMLGFGACLLVALGSMVEQLGASTIATTVLSFETNVLLLTLIGSDLVITSLDRARGLSTGTSHLVDASNRQLNTFVGET